MHKSFTGRRRSGRPRTVLRYLLRGGRAVPLVALLLGVLVTAGGLVAPRAQVLLPWYVPFLDGASVMCMAVVVILGSIDTLVRRDSRSLPIVAASAAIGTLWLPHLLAFPLAFASVPAFSGQTASFMFNIAQWVTPALLAVALLQHTGPIDSPRRAVARTVTSAVAFALVCAALAALLAPVLPPLVVSGRFTLFNTLLAAASVIPGVLAIALFLSGRHADERVESSIAAALILLAFEAVSSMFIASVYDWNWYATNLLRFLPIVAIAAGQLMLYGRSLVSERERLRDLATLQDMSRDLVSTLDLDTILDKVVTTSIDFLGPAIDGDRQATLYRMDESWYRAIAHHGPLGTHPGEVTEPLLAHPVLSRLVDLGASFAFRVDEEPELFEVHLGHQGLRSGACTLMYSRGAVVGAMLVATTALRDFDAPTLRLLEGGADLAGLAISNAENFRLVANSAATDFLTGLPNRREFERLLASLPPGPFGVLAIDIDNLKMINDEHGHQAGDAVLQAISSGLRGGLRGLDVVARVGGDEFAALLVGADAPRAAAVADRMRQSLRGLNVPFGAKAISIGYATGDTESDAREVWGHADDALLKAKRLGRNRVEGANEGLAVALRGSPRWTELVPGLLAPDRIEAVYQPIVRLADMSLLGWEALARPAGNEAGMSVEGLFHTAVRMGLGRDIDWFARRAAVHCAHAIPEGVQLFINVSIPALLDPLHDVDQMMLLLRWARRTPWDVVLEISEREAVTDMPRFIEVLAAYRNHGFRFAMDDVGEGHSTLEVLAAASPEYIKIARSLTLGAETSGPRAAISALVAFARSANAMVIAEGIETMRDADLMVDLGVDMGQGYAFGRPAAVPEYLAMSPAVVALKRQSGGPALLA
jgi:diguanylate cyclase (GGDEF)-like protein